MASYFGEDDGIVRPHFPIKTAVAARAQSDGYAITRFATDQHRVELDLLWCRPVVQIPIPSFFPPSSATSGLICPS